MFPRALSVLLAAILIALPAAAGYEQDMIQSWKKRMAESEAALQAADYARALRIADRTVSEMVERLGPGQGSTSLFTTALLHKALAHAGAGEVDEAIWYWHVALGLDPGVAGTDLAPFGEPARVLLENREPRGPDSAFSRETSITPPRLVKRKKPKYPHGAHYFGIKGDLVVEVIVGSDGSVRAPRIVSPLPAPTLSFAALEAVKRWSFEPARMGGRPVDIVFNLTVNYKQ